MSTNLETSSTSPHPQLPAAWIERLFERMSGYYGARFADAWRGIDPAAMKRCWAEELAGYSREEIARGVASMKTRDWPPTLPEFLKLCRPPTDSRAEWAEACEQMRIRLQGNGADRWSRPAVYWAAASIGSFDLNALSWEQIRSRWEKALDAAKSDPIPKYRAQLPAPGQESVTREEAASRMNHLLSSVGAGAVMPGATPDGTKWAVSLLEREARGDVLSAVSGNAWREVLGFPLDCNAKDALEAYRAQERAAA